MRPAIALAGIITLLTPVGAFAHAQLVSAVPPVGATVASAPDTVAITFSEGVEPAFSTLEVQNAGGTRVDVADVHTAPGNNRQLLVGLTSLPPGVYKVTWHVTSVDTHKTQGTFVFTLSP